MKKYYLTLIFCGLTILANAQDTSVEKSTFGIQVGLLGIWAHNEAKLSNQIVLRSELGFDPGIFVSDTNDRNGFILVPAITLEPRWYYNFNKRQQKSKRIDGNSGNFISIRTTYHPDWFYISNEGDINFISDILIIPTWGIRRNISNHFNYEVGFGIGYVHYFEEENLIFSVENGLTSYLHLRIGYRF